MSDLLQVTDETFDSEIVNSTIPALVDFWAEWCGPCRMIAPSVEELAKAYEGKIKFAKMDVDKNRQTPARFGIRSIAVSAASSRRFSRTSAEKTS
jgi:thioredoxin 1